MINSTETMDVDTPEGPGRFHCDHAERVQALLIMGHGAGGAIDAVDLSVLASRLPQQGITVVRFEQPWRVAGKKTTAPPTKLDSAWRAAVPQLLGDDRVIPAAGAVPVFLGGRSAGARVACRTAPEFVADAAGPAALDASGIAGVVCCAFPLHPPGRPDRSRAAELLSAGVPRLVLQGERDTFGGFDEVAAVIPDDGSVRLVRVPDADHSMRVRKTAATTPEHVQDLIAQTVAGFCLPR